MSRSVTVRLLVFCSLLAVLLTGCTRDPNVRKQKYFDSGEKYFAQGKYREAIIQYSNAVQVDPRFAQAHYQLSQAYLRLSDGQKAGMELARTVELAPDNYRAHTDLANLLTASRTTDGSPIPANLKEAKTHLDLLRDKAPNNPETHQAWANYYSAQRDFTSAISEAQQTIRLDPSRSESYIELGYIQLAMYQSLDPKARQASNLPAQIETSLRKGVDTDPKSMNAQLALGGFYQATNRLPDAEQRFRHVIDLDPKNPAPRAALVRVLVQQGKKDEAEAFLKQTKKDFPDNPDAYRMLGEYYFASGDLDKANDEYASLYKAHPKDIQSKKNYIQILLLKDQIDTASKLDNEILKSSPHDVEALIFKGEIQMRQNDAAGGAESLKSALTYDSNNALAHYQLGLAYSQQHDYTRAEQEWRTAIGINPSLTDADRALAGLEIARGNANGLLQIAQQILTTQPQAADGYLYKAIAELTQQPPQYQQAQLDAEEAQKRAPQSPAPYIQFANIQLAQKHYPEAEKFFQQALDKDPSSSMGLSGLMHVYIYQKNYDKAITAANAQIAKSPKTSDFYDLLATALYDGKKDYPGAEAALRKSLELNKGNVDAIVKLGEVELAQGQTDKALDLYLQSAKDNPGQVRFYLLAGELYEKKKDWDQAKAMYQQVLNIASDNPLAANNLAFLILEHGGNVDVALNLAQVARRAAPESPNFADTLGWAYFKKGVYQSAISECQEALRLNEKFKNPDDSDFHLHLGLAYQGAKQTTLARQQFERAIKISPENAEARRALSELKS